MKLFESLRNRLGFGETAVPLTEEEFSAKFIAALQKAAPAVTVAVDDGPLSLRIAHEPGGDSRAFLGNAYREYLRDPASGDVIIQRDVESVAELRGEARLIDPACIVPVVKDRRWLDEVTRAPGRAKTTPAAGDDPPHVIEELNEELLVVYAEDTPRNIRYFTPADLRACGLKAGNLRTLAIANLRRMLPQVELHSGPLVSMLTAGGDYVASLLLFDDLWTRSTLGIEEEIVVAVPARDLLLLADSGNAEGIEQLRKMARDAVRDSTYALTATLFVHRHGRFVPYVPAPLAGGGSGGNPARKRIH